MNKNAKSMALFAAILMVGAGQIGSSRSEPKKPKLLPNERKKCFRNGCNNHRVGNMNLYCSDECRELYRKEYNP